MIFYTFFGVAVIVAVHLFGYRLLGYKGRSARLLASLAGGTSVAYVFLQILPKLAYSDLILTQSEILSAARWQHHAFLLAMVGMIGFLGIDQMTKKLSLEGQPNSMINHFRIIVVVYFFYNFLVGYVLSFQWGVGGGRSLFLYVLAMSFHFLFVGYMLGRHHSEHKVIQVRWYFAAALSLGWLASLVRELRPEFLASLLALLAGAMIVITLKEELRDETLDEFFTFALGAFLYTILLMRI
ncbi:hypothetical protein [Billgrantia kenyensis]|uniref:Uncharacterized protein n=1 Tax=Billgrantia kenyensis TaxID=321266 RepID=A0A7V9W4B4_9GAMM|nr:hypothetical protein [Halomonas kenyensis]MBA2780827.1 hypothetical protein [Halomonas kenyensis]MCG6661725.1 hypothetical protein [Halomonas kenyensis]